MNREKNNWERNINEKRDEHIRKEKQEQKKSATWKRSSQTKKWKGITIKPTNTGVNDNGESGVELKAADVPTRQYNNITE